MPVKKTTTPRFDDLIFNNLKNKVEIRQWELLNQINFGINILFWNVGNQINNDLKAKNDNGNFINEVAKCLSPVFGNYFSVPNLSMMSELAQKCSYTTIVNIAAVTNWRYIPIFLSLDKNTSWELVNKIAHIESLSPLDLEKKISLEKLIETTKEGNAKQDYRFSRSKSFQLETIELYFKGAERDSFRRLFEPVKDFSSVTNSVHNETVLDIINKVSEFQIQLNYLLNLKFNVLFWEIGDEIIRLCNLFNKPVTDNLIEDCARSLHTTSQIIFNKAELWNCLKFASQYRGLFEYLEISETVSWQYLKRLLDIEDVKKQMWAANKILESGTTLKELFEILVHESWEHDDSYGHVNNERNDRLVSIEVTKERNKTTIGHVYEHSEPNINLDNDLNRNIFKNPDLLAFLKENLQES